MRTRFVLAVGVAVLLTALLAGCGGGDLPAPDDSRDDPAGESN